MRAQRAQIDYLKAYSDVLANMPQGSKMAFDTSATITVEKCGDFWFVVGVMPSLSMGSHLSNSALAKTYPVEVK
jgi:hypothetical protein